MEATETGPDENVYAAWVVSPKGVLAEYVNPFSPVEATNEIYKFLSSVANIPGNSEKSSQDNKLNLMRFGFIHFVFCLGNPLVAVASSPSRDPDKIQILSCTIQNFFRKKHGKKYDKAIKKNKESNLRKFSSFSNEIKHILSSKIP